MAVPTQSFAHTLNALKGWPSPSALDFVGQIASAITWDVPAGRCMHVDTVSAAVTTGGVAGPGPSTRGIVPQLKTGVKNTQMGIFLFQGSADYDVANPGVPSAGADVNSWYPIAPRGMIMGLVASGAYELETTEFDTAQTYTPNQLLRAVTDDTVATGSVSLTGGGCLTNQGVSYTSSVLTTACVGVVSRGKYTNAYGQSALAFWPVYLPSQTN